MVCSNLSKINKACIEHTFSLHRNNLKATWKLIGTLIKRKTKGQTIREMRERLGRCSIEWPARLAVTSFLYDKTSRSLPQRYYYRYLIVERPTLHEYAATQP